MDERKRHAAVSYAELEGAVVAGLRRIVGAEAALSPATELREQLGLNSLSMLAVLAELERAVGFDFRRARVQLGDLRTVRSLVDLVWSEREAG